MNDNAAVSSSRWSFTTLQGGSGLWVALGFCVDGQSTVASAEHEADALRRCKEIAAELSASEAT